MKYCKFLVWSLGLLLLAGIPLQGQNKQKAAKAREARVKGEAQVPMEKNMTLEQTQQLAIDQAIVTAIESEFGRVIFQGNTTYIENVSTGQRVETDMRTISIGNSYVNAEMIQMDEPVCQSDLDDKGQLWVTCRVRGKAREILEPPLEFIAEPLDCPEPRCKTTDFIDNESFYMLFKSPVEGHLSIYLADGDFAYCLLPCNGIEGSTFAVEQDKEYILFQDQDFLLYTDKEFETDRLFLIFSPKEYNKGLLQGEETFEVNGEDFIKPESMKVEDFQRWLTKLRSKRTDIQLKMIDISIKK